MPIYLESLDGSQSYQASVFVRKGVFDKLQNGKVYTLDELKFGDWIRAITGNGSPPQKKLIARMYGN